MMYYDANGTMVTQYSTVMRLSFSSTNNKSVAKRLTSPVRMTLKPAVVLDKVLTYVARHVNFTKQANQYTAQ